MKLPDSKAVIQFLLLVFILVGLPLGSFLYLQKGLDYRKGVMSKMGQNGAMPRIPARTVWGQLPDSLQGNLVLVGYLNPSSPEAVNLYGEQMSKMYEQFDSAATICFLTVLPADLVDSVWVDKFAQQYKFKDKSQAFFVLANQADWQQWTTAMKWPNDINPQIALVSDSLQIRAYFDLTQSEQVKDLVQLSAMIMPRKKDKELVFRREEEK